VALSTTETEYMTAVKTSKKALWLRRLVDTFGIIHDSALIYYDIQNAIHLAMDHMYHKQTKHINMRYHRIYQWVAVKKVIDLIKISPKKNRTYMMTKAIRWKRSEYL